MDNYDLSIRVIYVLGTLGFSVGTAVMAMFANVYVAMIMISTMGIVSMSISYCPYALLGQYHDIKEVRLRPRGLAGRVLGPTVTGHGPPGSRAWLVPTHLDHAAPHTRARSGRRGLLGLCSGAALCPGPSGMGCRGCSFGHRPAGARCTPACCRGSRRLSAPVVPWGGQALPHPTVQATEVGLHSSSHSKR